MSDAGFGDRRVLSGLDLTWRVQPPRSAADEVVRVIDITIDFNTEFWDDKFDVLDVFVDDDDGASKEAAVFTGERGARLLGLRAAAWLLGRPEPALAGRGGAPFQRIRLV